MRIELDGARTVVNVGGNAIGANNWVMIAGPCSVESYSQFKEIAEFLASRGVRFLRGGAYKPRTSPDAFQGMALHGLGIMREVANACEQYIVTEVVDSMDVDVMRGYVDVFQVGARNMYNYALLKRLGKCDVPVMLKRGLSATIEEWVRAADYVLHGGNKQVILCERGIRTFETDTRFTMSVSAIPVTIERSALPLIADPSHAAGVSRYVKDVALGCLAAGAMGLIVEVHNDKARALCDDKQALSFEQFDALLEDVRKLADVFGKEII